MKKLFFTLCALCLSTAMWADVDYDEDDTDRPTSEDAIYVDATTGLSFYLYTNQSEATTAKTTLNTAVLTYQSLDGDNYTSLTELSIPESVTIPDGETVAVTRIGAYAFAGSAVAGAVTIPANILSEGVSAFANCTGITSVTYDYSETALGDDNSSNSQGGWTFGGCTGITTVTLNRDITPGSSTRICGPFSFTTSITTIYIGENVTTIPAYMFRHTSTPYTLTAVYSYAANPPSFRYDPFSNLASGCALYTNYDDVNTYKANADWVAIFEKDNIHSVTGTDPDEPVDELAFLYEGLWYDPILDENGDETGEAQIIASQGDEYTGTITIPEIVYNDEKQYTVTRIDAMAFAGCTGITGEIIIPANILNMGKEAFLNCTGITTVTYEYNPTALFEENTGNGSGGSFSGCKGVTTVNMYRDITWSSTSSQNSPFLYVGTMSTINIGPRVTSILTHFFRNGSSATSLKTVNCYSANPATLASDALGVVSGMTINVPQGSKDAYETAWTEYNSQSSYASTIQEMSNAYAVAISLSDEEGNYYATYYNSNGVDIYPQGGTENAVTTYAIPSVTKEDEAAYINLTEVGATVPGTVAVLVEANAAGTYTVIETTAAGSASYSGGNCLYGLDEAGTITGDSSYYYYILTYPKDGDQVLGFYWATEDGTADSYEFAAHKAYLKLEKTTMDNVANVALRKGEGDTTGITTIEENTAATTSTGIYTVQGVRVSNMNKQGLYIVDGKKVLVK